MRTLELQQGNEAWHKHRAAHHNASEAPAMMGQSSKLKRSDLVRMKATGTEQQFSQWVTDVLFDRGHEVEAAARIIMEARLGLEFFPATGVSDDYPNLSASFDGVTIDEQDLLEVKQWNEVKAAFVRAGRVPPEDYWQCVQQLVVSRAKRLVYALSDGTDERTIHCELRLSSTEEKALVAGWKQFDEDVAAYKPDPAAAVVVGRAPSDLPALLIQVTGAVTQSNLPEFKARAIEVFRGIKTDLQTDEDFADAEQTVKFCKNVEERLDAAKQHALGQTATIDELFRALDDISAEARAKRLELDKLVKNRKEAIRLEIINGGVLAFREHVETINKRLRKVSLPPIQANFAGVIRGLKTVASIKDAVATELARVKIEANAVAEKIDANLGTLRELAAEHAFLFADAQHLVLKDNGDLVNLIKTRIADHEAEQRRRAEAQRPPSPTPPAAAAAPAQPMPVPAAQKPRMRADGPTAAQVVALVASTYGVTQATALGWLVHMNFRAVSEGVEA